MSMPATSQDTFSPQALIKALQRKGYSPYRLAMEMGASHEAVARWVGGVASPKPGYATQVARILGISIDDLYSDDDDWFD